jgi:transcription antitermination protein NusB
MTNPSLQKKSAARMAAVQCLYQRMVTDDAATPAEQVTALKARLANNRDEQKMLVGSAIEPNYPLAETLLSGVAQRQSDINERLDSALGEEWKRERMSPLLVAILQAAIFEMFFHKEINFKIVIDEYTRLTRSFFGEGEVSFVHGALSALAQKYHG